MSQERFLGVNIEHEGTNKMALASMITIARAYHLFRPFEVIGSLPKEGPALVVGNHTSSYDILKIAYASFTLGERMIRGVARRGLLDPNYKEPEAVLERTRKKGDSNPVKWPFVSSALAFVLNNVGAIPVTRGERNLAEDRRFLLTCGEVLNSGQLLGIFIQETRVKEGDLQNPMPGVALMARKYPDVPIVPVGIWTPRFGKKLVLGKAFTFNQLKEASNHPLNPRETTALITDRIAANLPQPIMLKWQNTDRPAFLAA